MRVKRKAWLTRERKWATIFGRLNLLLQSLPIKLEEALEASYDRGYEEGYAMGYDAGRADRNE